MKNESMAYSGDYTLINGVETRRESGSKALSYFFFVIPILFATCLVIESFVFFRGVLRLCDHTNPQCANHPKKCVRICGSDCLPHINDSSADLFGEDSLPSGDCKLFSDPTAPGYARQLATHGFLMTLAFPFFFLIGVMSWRSPAGPRVLLKAIHGLCMIGALSCAWYAVHYEKKFKDGAQMPNFATAHARIGIFVVSTFTANFAFGLLFALPISANIKHALIAFHRGTGLMLLAGTFMTVFLGLGEFWGLVTSNLSENAEEGTGVVYLALGTIGSALISMYISPGGVAYVANRANPPQAERTPLL